MSRSFAVAHITNMETSIKIKILVSFSIIVREYTLPGPITLGSFYPHELQRTP